MNKETKDRIDQATEKLYPNWKNDYSEHCQLQGFIAGATNEATKAEELLEALERIRKINIGYNQWNQEESTLSGHIAKTAIENYNK